MPSSRASTLLNLDLQTARKLLVAFICATRTGNLTESDRICVGCLQIAIVWDCFELHKFLLNTYTSRNARNSELKSSSDQVLALESQASLPFEHATFDACNVHSPRYLPSLWNPCVLEQQDEFSGGSPAFIPISFFAPST